ILLGGLKIVQEYRPRSLPATLILLAAMIGAQRSWRQPDTQVCLMLHAANMVGIALTWSVEGRFVVPLLFSIHILAARGFSWPLGFVLRRVLTPKPDRDDSRDDVVGGSR
ncbi:MAG: hypothetical protein KDA85_20075, partial [Planctomycetaceae bacterium]|nr:hypothetical protein [Planctomycetaceae bacterium]